MTKAEGLNSVFIKHVFGFTVVLFHFNNDTGVIQIVKIEEIKNILTVDMLSLTYNSGRSS